MIPEMKLQQCPAAGSCQLLLLRATQGVGAEACTGTLSSEAQSQELILALQRNTKPLPLQADPLAGSASSQTWGRAALQIFQVHVGFQTEPQLEASLSERSGKAAGRYLAVVQGRRTSTTHRGHPGVGPGGRDVSPRRISTSASCRAATTQPSAPLPTLPVPVSNTCSELAAGGTHGVPPRAQLKLVLATFIPPLSPDPLPAQRSQAANLRQEIWGKTTNIQTRPGG